MKSIYLALMGLCVLLISCNKNDDNNDNPPANTRDWFKLKTRLYSSVQQQGGRISKDSTEIIIDSANNKIVLKSYSNNSNQYIDTTIETYSYNSQNQLILYEHTDTYKQLFITRMEFVRDADGKVSKVLSQYHDGKMASSEGLVKYDKRGDTTFVTFNDSTQKHKNGYSDARDFYQTGVVNNKIVYYKDYSWAPGKLDSTQTWYEYDAAGNITTEKYQYRNTTPVTYTYQYGGETPKELQKFLSQWANDLLWFHRSKLFGFGWYFQTVSSYTGNVLLAKKQGNATLNAYTNTFDAAANLGSVTWQYADSPAPYDTYTMTEKYYYRP